MQQQTRQIGQQGQALAREAAPWIAPLARLGYAAKGVVYAIIGILALRAAFGAGGRTTDSEGALHEIVRQPFGQVLLAITGVGLIGYVVWCLAQALLDADQKGSDPKGLAARAGHFAAGVVYAGLALTAFQILAGSGGGGDPAQDWTARLLGNPLGRWAVGLAGLAVIGSGVAQIWKGWSDRLRRELRLGQMSPAEQTWAIRAGRLGLTAHGIVLGLIGFFLIRAAWEADPSEPQGLGAALNTLAAQPVGPWLLAAVAAGLIAYGLYNGVLARYRRMTPNERITE